MFSFQKALPSPDLRSYVKSIWQVEKMVDSVSPLMLVPDGFPEIFIQTGHGFSMHGAQGREYLLQGAMVLGQISSVTELRGQVGSKGIFIKIYPWTYHALVQLPMYHLVDTSLGAFESPSVQFSERLLAAIQEAQDFNTQIQRTNDLLKSTLRHSGMEDNPYLSYVLKNMVASRGMKGLDDYLSPIRCSRRYVEKVFRECVGLSPSRYRSVLRLKEISRRISEEDYDSFSQLAFQCGFHDAAHFTNHFARHVGMPPSQFQDYMTSFPMKNKREYLSQFRHEEIKQEVANTA